MLAVHAYYRLSVYSHPHASIGSTLTLQCGRLSCGVFKNGLALPTMYSGYRNLLTEVRCGAVRSIPENAKNICNKT